MYERIFRLYKEGRLDENGVWNAVNKGLITKEEAEKILDSDKDI